MGPGVGVNVASEDREELPRGVDVGPAVGVDVASAGRGEPSCEFGDRGGVSPGPLAGVGVHLGVGPVEAAGNGEPESGAGGRACSVR